MRTITSRFGVMVFSCLACVLIFTSALPAAAAECLLRQVAGQQIYEFELGHPGSTYEWLVGVENVTDDDISTSLEFSGVGSLITYIMITTDLCSDPWIEVTVDPQTFECQSTQTRALTQGPAVQSTVSTPSLSSGEQWHARVVAELDSSQTLPASLNGATGTVTSTVLANGLSGTQACPELDPSPSIPSTTLSPGTDTSSPGSGPGPQDPRAGQQHPISRERERLSFTGSSVLFLSAMGLGLVGSGLFFRKRSHHPNKAPDHV